MSRKRGIDVSYAQGDIDFSCINKNEVQFSIIRSSFGWYDGQKDSKFDRNIKGFQGLDIPCGAYHYSYAQNSDDAIKEAKYCISCIKDYTLQLPVFYDLEDSSIAVLGKRTCTDIAKAFCDYMKKSGFKTGIYMNLNWLENYVYKDELMGKYELWLAQWDSVKPYYNCSFWQYKVGQSGSINGISGEIDLDYMYTDSGQQHDDENKQKFQVGDIVKVLDPIDYDTGKRFDVYDGVTYSVIEAVGDRIVIGIDGRVTAAINAKYLEKLHSETEKNKHTYTYIIRSGDTLTSIAGKYHTTVQKIAEENHIKNPDIIYSGQVLHITV